MSRAAPIQHLNGFEAFLELESIHLERHEFVDGNLFVMAGSTDRHNWITLMLVTLLMPSVLKAGQRCYATDVLIRTPDDFGYYPDFFILKDTSLDTPKVKHRPSVIVEVLSPSTETIDRGEKLHNYRSIPSLEQYILLSQDEALGDMFSKQADGSWRHDILRSTSLLEIPSLGFSVALASMYENLPEA